MAVPGGEAGWFGGHPLSTTNSSKTAGMHTSASGRGSPSHSPRSLSTDSSAQGDEDKRKNCDCFSSEAALTLQVSPLFPESPFWGPVSHPLKGRGEEGQEEGRRLGRLS